MTEDIVRALGYLPLGTRLKRISERLIAQSSAMFEAEGIGLPSSLFPALAALDRLGPLPVGELAQALGISQPGVTRIVAKLKAEGLVKVLPATGDKRLKAIALTRPGRTLLDRTKHILWPKIERGVADACAGLSGSLLEQLDGLEDALMAEPLAARAERPKRKGSRHASA